MFIMMPGGYYILRMLGISATKATETEFFYQAVMSSLQHRRETKTRRNDLIDLMMDAIKGEIKVEEDEHANEQFEKVRKLISHCQLKWFSMMPYFLGCCVEPPSQEKT